MGNAVTGGGAAAALLRQTESLVRAVTGALYDERPELQGKYGRSGRDKCLQDMRHNIEHLAAAVDLGEPEIFRDYTTWLDGLLRARHVATDDLLLSFQLMELIVTSSFAKSESGPIILVLQAGINALGREAAP